MKKSKLKDQKPLKCSDIITEASQRQLGRGGPSSCEAGCRLMSSGKLWRIWREGRGEMDLLEHMVTRKKAAWSGNS